MASEQTTSARNIKELTPDPGAGTRLRYIEEDGAIWLDTDIGVEDGLCIGIGDDLISAAADALRELEARCADLRAVLDVRAVIAEAIGDEK